MKSGLGVPPRSEKNINEKKGSEKYDMLRIQKVYTKIPEIQTFVQHFLCLSFSKFNVSQI